MKKSAIFLLLALGTSTAFAEDSWNCTNSNGEKYSSPQNVDAHRCSKIETDALIIPASFFENIIKEPPQTKMFCKSQRGAICGQSDGDYEAGEFLGARYHLYRESGAVTASKDGGNLRIAGEAVWDIGCTRDKMTSKRTCHIHKGDLFLLYSQAETENVLIGFDHFPGSTTAIKIGSRRYNTSERDGNFPANLKIGTQLLDGTPVVTRYMKWPYREWVDDEFTVYGAQTAIHLAKWLLKNGTF